MVEIIYLSNPCRHLFGDPQSSPELSADRLGIIGRPRLWPVILRPVPIVDRVSVVGRSLIGIMVGRGCADR
jgi:hypothetical protein